MPDNQRQLRSLAKPFHASVIKQKPGRGDNAVYVTQSAVTQRLLGTIGPFDMSSVELIRGTAPKIRWGGEERGPYADIVVGAIVTFRFHVDGRDVTVAEVGATENPSGKDTDGDRAKSAVSDALKRAAMRISCGLHLWGKDDDPYFLPQMLTDEEKQGDVSE